MKKLTFLAVVAALLSPVAAKAQYVNDTETPVAVQGEAVDAEAPVVKKVPEYGFFNHVGVGVSVGIMDGATINVGVPLGSHFALRGGYNFTNLVYKFKKNFNFGEFVAKRSDSSTDDWNLDNIPVEASLDLQYFGLVDIYPCKKGSFHLSAGIVGGTGDLLSATADLTGVEKITPEDYAKTTVTYNDFTASTDSKGFAHIGARTKSKVMPYFGIGFGRICNIAKRVSFSFDLGVIKTGGIKVYGRDYVNKTDSYVTSETVDHEDSFGDYSDLIDKAAAGDLPYVKDFLPYLKLGVNVLIF